MHGIFSRIDHVLGHKTSHNKFGKVEIISGFPGDLAGKESACHAGDLGFIPGLGRSPGEGYGYPVQYSALENSMDCIVHGVSKSWIQLSDFHFHCFI